KNGSGRKRKTADEVDRAILNFVRNNRWDSLISLRDELSLNVCINTIRNRLKEAKYRRYIAARKEWINNRHKEERMNYARIYSDWLFEDWKYVIFMDETSIDTNVESTRHVTRKRGERYLPENINFVRNSGRLSVSVYGWMSSQEQYVEILSQVLPKIENIFEDGFWHLVHDNCPSHRAKLVTKFFEENNVVSVLPHPPKSPDLNIIESIWSKLKSKVRIFIQSNGKPSNANALFSLIKREWEYLKNDADLIESLYMSLPNRMTAVINNNGNATRY
ncbi:transposase-like protein, partial [Dinothrombium tinctorium]